MNIELRQPVRTQETRQKTRYGIVDCDIHPKLLLEDFRPHLSNQWWSHLQTDGLRPRHGFAQVFMLSRTAEAHGRRRYWPIYQAAVEAGLPVGIHVFGYSGWALTNSGWPSFYIEEMTEHATGQAAVVASMIFEGLFEQY